MNRPDPKAFIGGPSIHPAQQPSRVVEVLPRSVPTLTVYADGRVNPSREATHLLQEQDKGLCFHPPTPVRPGCHPKLWEVSPGQCHLFRVAGKADHTQLRAAGQCPPPGRYLFTPTSIPHRYALVPTG